MPESESRALLLMDLQRGIVERFGADPAYLEGMNAAAAAARAAGLPVVWVGVRFRPGHPEVSARNLSFARVRGQGGGLVAGAPESAIHPGLAVEPTDLQVTKLRVSAFAGSDLEVLLRAAEVRHLVLAGIATSGVVLSTVRQAADMDFGLTVLADGCLDADAEVHRVLMDKVFPRQAAVLPIGHWVASLGA